MTQLTNQPVGKYRFRLNGGMHVQDEFLDQPCKTCKGTREMKVEGKTLPCIACRDHKTGEPTGKHKVERRYRAGDTFESEDDLATMLNQPGGYDKVTRIIDGPDAVNPFLTQPAPGETEVEFKTRMARLAVADNQSSSAITGHTVPDEPPPAPKPGDDAFDRMNEKELKAFAANEEIDLKGAKNRGEVIKVLRAAMTGPHG